jgi:hypothetical protein
MKFGTRQISTLNPDSKDGDPRLSLLRLLSDH